VEFIDKLSTEDVLNYLKDFIAKKELIEKIKDINDYILSVDPKEINDLKIIAYKFYKKVKGDKKEKKPKE
jgi:hypothetical protein